MEDANGTTSPEELLAIAHSACCSMALSGIALTVRGDVDDLDAAAFAVAAHKAKEGCPLGNALTGVEIHLDATLETSRNTSFTKYG